MYSHFMVVFLDRGNMQYQLSLLQNCYKNVCFCFVLFGFFFVLVVVSSNSKVTSSFQNSFCFVEIVTWQRAILVTPFVKMFCQRRLGGQAVVGVKFHQNLFSILCTRMWTHQVTLSSKCQVSGVASFVVGSVFRSFIPRLHAFRPVHGTDFIWFTFLSCLHLFSWVFHK